MSSLHRTLRNIIMVRLMTQTVRALADELGVPFATVQKFSDGTIERPRLDLCERLARGLGYEITLQAGERLGSGERQRRSIRGKPTST
jgi:hypothetical protein